MVDSVKIWMIVMVLGQSYLVMNDIVSDMSNLIFLIKTKFSGNSEPAEHAHYARRMSLPLRTSPKINCHDGRLQLSLTVTRSDETYRGSFQLNVDHEVDRIVVSATEHTSNTSSPHSSFS